MNKRRRQKNKKKVKSKKKIAILIAVILLILLLLKILIFDFYLPSRYASTEAISIMTVGVDTNSYREELWEEGDKATLTDSIMVWTFNPKTMQVVVTSIPRDTSVDYVCDGNSSVPDYQDQINELYYLSGYDMDCLEDTVSNFLNVPIDYYVKVNMDQIVEIIDTVGPLTIIAHAQDEVLTQADVNNTETYTWYDGETYEMMGDEALTYARARHDSEKDYGRGLRQQQVIEAVLKAIADSENNTDLLNEIFSVTETDLEYGILYKYFEFWLDITNFYDAVQNKTEIEKNTFTDEVWENLFKTFDYNEEVNQENINAFIVNLNENSSNTEVVQYFIKSYQFYNEVYSGHYNVVEEQLQEISDALRENLGLPKEKVSVPSKSYGDNEASGLIPTEWATGSSESSSNTDTNAADDTEDDAPVQTTPPEEKEDDTSTQIVEDSDTDGDGVVDTEDVCEGSDDTIDTDGDGVPDGCDVKDDTDTDGDGIVDAEDVCEGSDDRVDTDGDGVPDGCDTVDDRVDIDGDGVVDAEDVCEGSDDTIDTDGDGVPDGCDVQ